MKTIRRIIISIGIVGFAVCCGAMLLFNWHALGYKTLDVPTGSMRPTIPPGSLVLMKSVPISTIKVGDIINYTNPRNVRETITHRVIRTYKIAGKIPAFITKGDANPSADPPVIAGLVKGKAAWHISYAGRWLQWSKTWPGLIVLLYLPALLLMIEEVQRMADYLRAMQPYKLFGYRQVVATGKGFGGKLAASASLSLVIVAANAAIALPVQALLKSNTVALVNNQISVAAVQHCSGKNDNDININNSNNQSASSGNVSSSGNTIGGSATSGSASNSNNTNITITITNC
jgi:signal peptidase I